jgi:hypothetical protein
MDLRAGGWRRLFKEGQLRLRLRLDNWRKKDDKWMK